MKTLRQILAAELREFPEMEEKSLSDRPSFVYYEYRGKGIAHFDSDFELDLKLTKAKISKEGLEHPKDSTIHPNRYRTMPHWIVLPFKTKSDIRNIVRLVKIATDQE